MDLDEYLSQPDALSVTELRVRLVALGYNVKSDAQIRQWRYRYNKRLPSPENCAGLEIVTGKQVIRQHLRPDDWPRIWPELVGQSEAAPGPSENAPEPSEAEVAETNEGA